MAAFVVADDVLGADDAATLQAAEPSKAVLGMVGSVHWVDPEGLAEKVPIQFFLVVEVGQNITFSWLWLGSGPLDAVTRRRH